jgi:hypothetical protein
VLMATVVALPLAGLSACGEKPQTAGQGAARKADAKGWEGVSAGAEYTAGGYKAGDKATWEAQLKARAERGQNEYSHMTSAKP